MDIKLGLMLCSLVLLCALSQGCAEGVLEEECGAGASDLYDYAQLVFFMALGAGTRQLLFGGDAWSRVRKPSKDSSSYCDAAKLNNQAPANICASGPGSSDE